MNRDDRELCIKVCSELYSVLEKYPRYIGLESVFSLYISEITLDHSKQPTHRDEVNEHMLMQVIEDKLIAYRSTIKLIREKGMEHLLKEGRYDK